jgi:hypothetical protein
MIIPRDSTIEPMLDVGPPPVPIANIGPEERATIEYTELPEDKSDSSTAREWNCYRREAGRLLADGREGQWVLIKGEEVVGIWATREEAKKVAVERYLMQAVLIRQVLRREPILRGPTLLRQCRS